MSENNLKMFCLTLEPSHLNFIYDLNYIPVGLGKKKFPDECLSDKKNENISEKNKFYGEYTFHYWLWKNYLDDITENWIGFCQYRKFWSLNFTPNNELNLNNLKEKVLKDIPKEFNDFDVILGDPFFVNKRKIMKFLKKGFPLVISNPKILFNEKYRNIKFHFDLMHGRGNLDKAIDLLNQENKNDFRDFVNDEVSFNPHNMFICKSKNLLKSYYGEIFPWLEKCEKLFGFDELKGYGLTRIYGFLAERFMSYWFKKNANYKELPILFHDVRDSLRQ
tara:strand:- start:4368 stop:5198 length:831 start_codon:yes stop_codon:yes gene_type:complete